jgi:adenosylcobyric acid synthase
VSSSVENYRAGIETALDELADGLENCLDIDALFALD